MKRIWSQKGTIFSVFVVIAGAVILGFSAVSCGVEAASNSGAWMDGPNGQKVWCVGNQQGGLSCDWDGMHKGNVR